MAEVRLLSVSHRYPGTDADTLRQLDLTIEAGEAHALLGGSGAGKTTLVNLLSGLLVPSAGNLTFDDRDVTRLAPRDRDVAQVFQFPVLYQSMTVADILAFPLRNRGWRRAAARERAADIAERLDLAALLGTRAAALTLFQKQLVAIGRALVRPDIALVLLDEPLTAVEPATKWQLRRVIKAIQRELGATMVYVTHDQTEALTFADRISVMHDGAILQTGTPEALYDKPDHEHVAHFIGSPGMNLLGAEVADGTFRLGGRVLGPAGDLGAGPCTVGFRPEWAVLERAGGDHGVATVTGTRILGVELHRPVGIVTADLDGQLLRTRQVIDVAVGDRVLLRPDADRLLGFRNGRRLTAGAERAGA
ncbi:MAG: ABC transporter ATP-binding protein [Pseudomonadales bacterium]